MSERNEYVWTCKVVGSIEIPDGLMFDAVNLKDAPMRAAVVNAAQTIPGFTARHVFSGWGDGVLEKERAVMENRSPRWSEGEMGLAEMILRTAELHEASYDAAAYAAACIAHGEAMKALSPGHRLAGLAIDPNKYYRKTLIECAEEACGHDKVEYPVYLLLMTAWNDAMEWATSVVSKRT